MAVSDKKEEVWEKAKKIRGRDPAKHREDPEGNVIFHGSYGKDTEMGWEIDHKVPKSKGGSDDIGNLQALQTSANQSKGASTTNRARPRPKGVPTPSAGKRRK